MVDPQLISSLIRSAGGRPTGSTIDASKTLDDRKRKAFDDAANIFSELKTMNKLPRGGLKQIIERAKVENGLEDEENWTISADSVRSRHRNNIKSSNGMVTRGPTSPLALVEPLPVELCIQRARMGQPLSQSLGILLVNSIIQGTVNQEKLRQFQIGSVKMTNDAGNLGYAGNAYCTACKERNKGKLDDDAPVSQPACRKEWSYYLMFFPYV
jgi:hypothetical protein